MTRALRRHQKERMKARAKRIAKTNFSRYCADTTKMEQRRIDHEKFFIKNAENLAVCSSWCCGNPRRHWKGDDRITIQERKANIYWDDIEKEYEDEDENKDY